MEDRLCHLDKLAGDPSCGLFGIFDGHGGKQVAEHCAESFPIELDKEIRKNPKNLYDVLQSTFMKIDKQLFMVDSGSCGSTACVAVVRIEDSKRVLYVANVGDTRAVLNVSGVARRLSVDHKATDRAEINRI